MSEPIGTQATAATNHGEPIGPRNTSRARERPPQEHQLEKQCQQEAEVGEDEQEEQEKGEEEEQEEKEEPEEEEGR